MSVFKCSDCSYYNGDSKPCTQYKEQGCMVPRFWRMSSSVDEMAKEMVAYNERDKGFEVVIAGFVDYYETKEGAIEAAKAWLMELE